MINRLMRMCTQSSRPQSGSVISKSRSLYVHIFDTGVSKLGWDFDHTSTLGGRSLVEISIQLRHLQCRNFDQTSTPLYRSLVEISTKLRPPGVEVRSKFRPNFDTGVSKSGRNFDQTSA